MWTDAQEQDLKGRFLRFYGSGTLWRFLRDAYTEPHRHYHDLGHLAALFAHFDRVRHQFHYPEAAEHALWWHDVAYFVDRRRDESELRSAMLFRKSLVTHANALLNERPDAWDLVEIGCAFIEATREHAVSSPILANDVKLTADARLFLDIDLAILAEDVPALRRFEEGVRQEYIQYSDRVYTFGRIAVLQAQLARDKIFLSPAFAPLERKARDNLARLIAELTVMRDNAEE